MEYQCFYLSPNYKLGHEDDAEVLFESDDFYKCSLFVWELFTKEGKDVAVYQPRIEAYREYYRKPARDTKGRFTPR